MKTPGLLHTIYLEIPLENQGEKWLCGLPSRNICDSSEEWFDFFLGDLVSLVTDGIILLTLASGKHRAQVKVPLCKDFL